MYVGQQAAKEMVWDTKMHTTALLLPVQPKPTVEDIFFVWHAQYFNL